MKLTLFFCAGCIHVETHTDYISEMAGIGKRMPVVMGAFTVAAFGMAGIPLLAGFVSKYYMLIGGIQMGAELTPVAYYLVGALLLSGVLNVAYFWPVIYTAFFESESDHDAKPLVDFRMGGERRSTLAATDGGRAGDDEDVDELVEDAEETESDVQTDNTVPDDSDVPNAEVDEIESDDRDGFDDLPTDEEGVVRPDFDTSGRDFSETADRVDTGDYAVDQRPSDVDVPFGVGRGDSHDDRDGRDGDHDAHDDSHDDAHETDDGHGDSEETHDDHGHHGGPPAGGWDRIRGLDALRGRESTWFMLGPILTAMTLAVMLGVIPYEMGFLELIELIVDTRLPEGVARP